MMSMREFEEEKARLTALYGSTGRDAGQKRAQALAHLYVRTGWNERALAEVEHMSHSRINQLLIYGRFLLASIAGQDIYCPESRFSHFWKQTDKTATEQGRFAAVAAMLEEAQTAVPAVPMKKLGKTIVAQFADGKWHRLEAIAEAVQADPAAVRPVLDRIVAQGLFKTYAEKRQAGKGSASYRLVKGGARKINMTAFLTETKPLLDEIDEVINGHQIHFKQATMKMLFAQFRKAVEDLAH